MVGLEPRALPMGSACSNPVLHLQQTFSLQYFMELAEVTVRAFLKTPEASHLCPLLELDMNALQ